MKQEKNFSIIAPVCYIISAVLLFYALFSLVALIIPPPPPPPPTTTTTTTTTIATNPPRSDTEENQKDTIITSCGTPCKASPKEIKEATIRKVEYSPQPGTGLNELHLDVETADQQNFIIHVSPEYKISRCPDLFRFHEGETVTVVGFELLGNQANICAAEITRQSSEALKLRDRTTGEYDNTIFNHEICKKELLPSIYSCGKSWKTPLMEIEGTIRKVEYRKPPGGSQKGLHFDVETADKQSVVIHVFPEPKTSQCPDLFTFKEGETVTVVGSEFSTPQNPKNICASGIIGQNIEPSEVTDQNSKMLKLRDPITGNHNNAVFNNKICIDEDGLKRSSLFNWMKAFLSYQESCKHCMDELALWNNPEGILASCKDCSGYIGIIPKEYSRANDCVICQENRCSPCSSPNVMPPKCWKACMKRCGTTMGNMTGDGVKRIEENDKKLQKKRPDLWKIRLERRRRESLRAYLLFLLLIMG